MKYLIFILLLASNISAQDCGIVKEKDRFSGETNYRLDSTLFVSDNKGSIVGIDIKFDPSYNSKYLIVINTSLNCVDENSSISIIFADETLMTLSNVASFNCDGAMMFLLKGVTIGQQATKNIYSKKIKAFRLKSMSSMADVDLEPEDSEVLFKYIQCLGNLSK